MIAAWPLASWRMSQRAWKAQERSNLRSSISTWPLIAKPRQKTATLLHPSGESLLRPGGSPVEMMQAEGLEAIFCPSMPAPPPLPRRA